MDDCGESGANSHPPYHKSEMRLNVNISYVVIQLHESPIFGICLNCFHSLDGGVNLHSTWKKSMELAIMRMHCGSHIRLLHSTTFIISTLRRDAKQANVPSFPVCVCLRTHKRAAIYSRCIKCGYHIFDKFIIGELS